jgi:competence protein ComEC
VTRIVLAFLIGMCLAAASASVPSPAWLLAALPCLLILRQGSAPALILALLAGSAWLYVHAHGYLQARDQIALQQDALWLEGRVQGLPRRSKGVVRFNFLLLDDQHLQAQTGDSYLLAVSWEEPTTKLRAGDHLRLKLRLRPPRSLANPASFDAERWYMSNSIHASGWVLATEPLPGVKQHFGLGDRLHHLRQAIANNIRQHTNGVAAAILPALAVADRSGLADHHWRILTATGTGHLLAISGLHIGLVAAAGFLAGSLVFAFLCSKIERFWRPDVAAMLAMLLALAYSSLAGFSLSTVRATMMLAVVLSALALRSRSQTRHSLAFALAVVLLLEPFAPLKPGFWLSFCAVACLLAGFAGRAREQHRMTQWWRAQIVVFLGLGPILLLLGSTLSLSAPIVNLIAIPLTGLLIVPPLLLAVVTMAVAPALTAALLQAAALSSEALWWLLSVIARWPLAEMAANLPWQAVVAALLGSALLLSPRGFPGRLAGILALGGAVMSATATQQVRHGEVSMHVIDVGQGLSVLVRTRTHALLYDSGPVSRSGFNAGARVVLPYLKHLGLSRIDTLISSHGDSDHAGGAEVLLSWSGPLTAHVSSANLAQAEPCRRGDGWQWDGVFFEFLHPTPFLPYLGNDSSCVLLISTTDSRLLLPGDITAVVEQGLIKQYEQLRVDLMLVPHHGSKTSSSKAFLLGFQPELAIVSSAYRNRFGMPHSEVVSRFQAQGIGLLNTADCGRLVLLSEKGRGIVVNTAFRSEHNQIWRAPYSCEIAD